MIPIDPDDCTTLYEIEGLNFDIEIMAKIRQIMDEYSDAIETYGDEIVFRLEEETKQDLRQLLDRSTTHEFYNEKPKLVK